jgi:hypothetical protein
MVQSQGIQVLRQRHSDGISIGFTGTREGMTTEQWMRATEIFATICMDRVVEWHDGDCVGADEQIHGTAKNMSWIYGFDLTMHGHPCNLDKFRANRDFDVLYPIKPPLARNRDIVAASDVMIAAPKEYDEVLRGSGTWATIRYSKGYPRPLVIVWPDATTTWYNLEGGLLDEAQASS